jgi:cysteine desulfurase
VGTIPVNVNELGVDLLTLSANAFYGPKGAAALYVRKGVRIFALIDGGIQERGKRAGTENVPACVGLGKASELAQQDMMKRAETAARLRDLLLLGLEKRIPKLVINGNREHRLPGNVHISVEAVEGESLLFSLAAKDVLAASGSSCADKALKTSHVLNAIGLEPAIANGSVLFSLGFDNTESEVDHVLEVLPPIAERLRSMSPLWGRG